MGALNELELEITFRDGVGKLHVNSGGVTLDMEVRTEELQGSNQKKLMAAITAGVTELHRVWLSGAEKEARTGAWDLDDDELDGLSPEAMARTAAEHRQLQEAEGAKPCDCVVCTLVNGTKQAPAEN